MPIKWVAARVQTGTAKGAKSVLHHLAQSQDQRQTASALEPCAQIEFQSTVGPLSLTEAQQHLAELVRDLAREGELVITEANKPVARLAPLNAQTSLRNLTPTSVGAVLRPYPSSEDDTLGEMLDSRP